MNEFINECTDNFADQKEKIAELSIVDIVKAYDYINTISQFVPGNNEVLDDLDVIIEPLGRVIGELRTDETCRHCNGYLFKSDLPQYDYVCPMCNENF